MARRRRQKESEVTRVVRYAPPPPPLAQPQLTQKHSDGVVSKERPRRFRSAGVRPTVPWLYQNPPTLPGALEGALKYYCKSSSSSAAAICSDGGKST